jgi:regulation of enolase protein 1 (concanavalin A-like superfamily)
MGFDISKASWVNKPKKFHITDDKVIIQTEPETDFWQKTYYGFSHDNGHALLLPVEKDFTFTAKASFDTDFLYEHCGIFIHKDSENWCKASVEYGNKDFSQLGSVLTNLGFSDWATTDISSDIKKIWYRLSRRGKDFLIESSFDGKDYMQMRMFHMHEAAGIINIGLFACSPLESSFTAEFTEMELTGSIWKEHEL